jgi:hypothetical protein
MAHIMIDCKDITCIWQTTLGCNKKIVIINEEGKCESKTECERK